MKSPAPAPIYIEKLEGLLLALNYAKGTEYRQASGEGRMVTTMDRCQAYWRIVERGWNAHSAHWIALP